MNATQAAATASKNLGLNIEQKTRAKIVKAAKDALDRFSRAFGSTDDAIKLVNGRVPMARARATGFEGDGSLLLEAASNLQREGTGDDVAWVKALHDVEKAQAALHRALLRLEAVGQNRYADPNWIENSGE